MSSLATTVGIGVFAGAMIYAAFTDLRTRTIGNWLIVALLFSYLVLAPIAGFSWADLQSGFVPGLIVLGGSFAFFTRGWIGGGDVKLASVSALWLGSDQTPSYLLCAALLGGVLTVGILLLRTSARTLGAEDTVWARTVGGPGAGVPYGVALSAAALVFLPASRWAGL